MSSLYFVNRLAGYGRKNKLHGGQRKMFSAENEHTALA